jgi:HEAT repeat protein
MILNRSIAMGLILTLCLIGAAGAAPVDDAIKALPAYKPGDDTSPLKTIEQAAQTVTAGQADRLALSNQLLGVLADPNATVHAKRFVCGQLVLVGGDEAVKPLARLLADDELVHMACSALGRIDSEKATGGLIEYLDRVEGDALVTLINTIGLRGDAKAVPFLAEIADQGEPAARAAAISAIGQIGGTAAATKLTAMAKTLNDADAKLRKTYFHAALACAESETAAGRADQADALLDAVETMNPPRVIALAAQRSRLLTAGPNASSKLLEMLGGRDAALHQVAATYLRDDAQPATVLAVLAKADQLSAAGHVVAIQTAAAQHNAKAAVHVRDALASKDDAVRIAAIIALADLGTTADLPKLISAAAADDDAGAAAAKVLVKFKAAGAESALIDQLEKHDGKGMVALIDALAARGVSAAAPKLLELARADDAAVRHAALRASGQVAELEHVDALVAIVAKPTAADDIRHAEAAARGVFGRVRNPDKCGKALLKHLPDTTKATEPVLVKLMPAAPTNACLEAVRQRTNVTDDALRDAAIRALIDWPGNAPMADLRRIAESSDSKKYRVLTLRGYIDRAASAKDLAVAMKLAERREEKLAVLGKVPHDTGGVDIAAAAMADQSLQREAIDALLRIAEKAEPKDVTNLADPLRRAAALTKDAKTTERLNKAIAKHNAGTG